MIKDLSMMYRALWDRRHEGATRISQCTRRVAPSALTYPSGPLNANMFKGEIIWIVCFVHYVSIVFNEINDNSNKNSGSIL